MKPSSHHLCHSHSRVLQGALLAAVALLAATRASAQVGVDTWVDNGTINFADPNWTSSINGPNYVPISGDAWVFNAAGPSGTTLNNNLTALNSVAGITFSNVASAYTFTNNAITLTGGITNFSASLETINFPITSTAVEFVNLAGGGGITLGGGNTGTGGGYSLTNAGTLTFTGTNSFTGATTIGVGSALTIGSTGQLGGTTAGVYAGAIANAGTYNFNGANSQTNSGVISGAGALNINGPGTLTLSGADSYTGNIIVNGGILSDKIEENAGNPTVGGLGNPRTAGRTATINTGGIISLDASGGNDLGNGTTTPVLAFIVNQGGTLRVTQGNAGVGPITLNGGTLSCATANTTGTEYEAFELGGTVTVGGTSPSVISSTTGNQENGVNLTINSGAGQLNFNVASTGSSSPDLTVSAPMANSGGITTGVNGFVKTGAGTLALTATNYFTGNITVSNGLVTITNAGVLNSGNYAGNITNYSIFTYGSSDNQNLSGVITNTGTLNFASSATVTVLGAISGPGGTVNQNGSGTVILSGSNSYTGATTVNAGKLVVTAAQPNTASPVVVNDGGALVIVAAGTSAFAPASLTLGSSAGATLQLGLNSTTQAPLAPLALTLVGNNTVLLSGGFVAGNTYPVLSYTTLSGLGTLNFSLPNGVGGTVTPNTVLGVTTYSLNVMSVTNTIWKGTANGTWDINTTGNWSAPSGGNVYLDGSPVQFDDTGANFLITNLLATTVSPATIFVTNNANNYAFSNSVAIGGAGGITKTGTANLTNFTVNAYTGPTIINGGSLVAGVAAPSGPGAFGLNSAVSLANAAGATLNLNGFSTQIGSLAGGGSTGGNVALGAGSLTLGGDGSSQTYAGVISGTGGLTKIGGGTLTLTGVNTFTGAIGGTAGTLIIGGAGQLNSGAYAGAIADNGLINYASTANQALSGVISGIGGLTMNGGSGSTLTLGTAVPTFTGTTTVNSGTLILTGPNAQPSALADSTNIIINNGGTIQVNSDNAFIGQRGATAADTITINYGGTLTVLASADGNTGASSHIAGTLNLNGGTLAAPVTAVNAFANWGFYGPSVVVNGGVNQSVISAFSLASAVSGGTPFNITNGGTASGVDLLVTGGFDHTSDPDDGIIKNGAGTMELAGANTTTAPITINAGTLILGGNGSLTPAAGTYNAALTDNGVFICSSTYGQTLGSLISGTGSLQVVGSGVTLTLTNVDTYTGPTTINAGTLYLSGVGSISNSPIITITNGGIFDASELTTPVYTMGASQILIASNTVGAYAVNGSVITGSASQIFPGGTNIVGTLTFNNALTLTAGTGVNLDLNTLSAADGGADDEIIVNGALTIASGQTVTLNALSGAANLDASKDYVLFSTPGGMTGAFSAAPIWTGTKPLNYTHFIVTNDTVNNQVRLTYTANANPAIASATAAPATGALRNQPVLFTVTVTPGTAGITSVSLNLSTVGGAASAPLVLSGTPNVWTNTYAVGPTALAGAQSIPILATDANGNQGASSLSLSIVTSTETWGGGGTAGQENFDNNANWTVEAGGPASYAPGYVGDSLIFAGAGGTAGPNPIMDNSYTLTGLSFSNNAASFDITPANSSVLTLGGGGVTNNSASTQTLAVPITLTAPEVFSAGPGNLVLSGVIADSGTGLTTAGPGTVTLSAVNTYTGATTVSSGTLNLLGTLPGNALILRVGSTTTASNAVLQIGPAATIGQMNNWYIGNFNGQSAAIYQTGGAATVNGGGGDVLDIGNVAGAYGYYGISGGTISANGIGVAGEGNSTLNTTLEGNGIMEVNGGAVTDVGWVVMSRTTGTDAGQTGIFNIYSGSLTYEGGGFVVNWGGSQTSIINIMGGSVADNTQEPLNLNESGNAANTGIVNLLSGGLFEADSVIGGTHGFVNFNGGMLEPSETSTTFMTGLGSAYIYSAGATITNIGYDVTIGQPFLAPPGSGVAAVTSYTGGAGYIAPPIVAVSGGGGSGATAIAQIDTSTGGATSGQVTNILITCPGINYSTTPTFTFSGGGASSQAAVTAVTLTPNACGTLSVAGSGTTTLTGVSTYTNATIINAATLQLGAGGSINNSAAINVTNSGIFDLSLLSSFTLGSGQRFEGTGGTINAPTGSSTVTGSGASIYPGTDGTIGTLNFDGGLTMASGSTANFDLSTSSAGPNDAINVSGTLVLNGNALHIKAPSTSSVLDTSAPYVLITAGSVVGNFALTPVWDVKPANATGFSVQTAGNSEVILTYSTLNPPTGTGTATPSANVLRNTNIFVSVTVHPGSTPTISGVTVDTTLLGGGPGQTLVEVGSSDVYTNTFLVAPTTLPGSIELAATITDTANQIGLAEISLTVVASTETWSGANQATDQNSDDGSNWVSKLAPGYSGDSLVFAGATGLAPVLDQNYTVAGLTFAGGAGLFDVGNSTYGTSLALAASSGMTNLSAATETVNVPVVLNGAATLSAASGTLVIAQPVGEAIAGEGVLISAGPSTNILQGVNTYTGSTTISSGTLAIGPSGQLNSGAYAASIIDNGTLAYDSQQTQALTGAISGTGGITVNGGATGVLTIGSASTTAALSPTYTGPTIVNTGTLQLDFDNNNAVAQGIHDSTNLTINNGGTVLVMVDNSLAGSAGVGPLPVTINAGGVLNGLGTADGGQGTSTHIPGLLTLNGGTLTNGGSGDVDYGSWDLDDGVVVPGTSTTTSTMSAPAMVPDQAGGTVFNITNGVVGGIDLNVTGTLIKAIDITDTGIIKNGNGTMALAGQNTYTGPTVINGGILNLGAAENAGASGPLGNSAASNPGSIVFGGGTLQYSAANGANDYSGRFSTAAGQLVSIDVAGQSVSFATALTSSGGTLTLADSVGAGVLTLTAQPTYTGNTTIKGGRLALPAGISLASASSLSIAAGGIFDVSSQASYTLGAGASLTASGAAIPATIASQAISLGSRPVILNYDGVHPALTIASGGTLSLNGNAFTVNTSSPLGAGHYVLIQQTNGAIATAGAYTVAGTAIGAADQGTITVNTTQVILNISIVTPPTITFTTSGNNTSLNLSWPPAYLGSTLLYQSNTVAVGLQTNSAAWLVWPGSTGVTSEIIPIGKTNEMFFQLNVP